MPLTQSGANPEANIRTYNDVTGNQVINATNITNVHTGSGDDAILAMLKPVDHNRHYVQPCMEGTRKDIFKEIQRWLDQPGDAQEGKNILWITGSPGAGKSAIASSLISKLRADRRLGGSFTFRRGDTVLSDPAALWRTVAFDLARFDPDVASAVITALKEGSVDPQRPDIAAHFDILIKESLERMNEKLVAQQNPRYPVVIVDALDECDDPSQNPQRKTLLDTLTRWSKLPKKVKLIITARDDRLPESFRQACQKIVLPTGDKVTPAASEDIQTFFESRFKELKTDLPSLAQAGWPAPRDIEQLTTRAAGLFIWAKTAMSFIEEGHPQELLKFILSGGSVAGEEDVYHLYRQVVTHALTNLQKNKASQAALQPLLQTIVFAKVPLSREHLQHFLVTPIEEIAIDFVFREFKSVILIGEDGLVRISHLSFVEFLIDSDLCPEFLRIPRAAASTRNLEFLRSCLQIMGDSTYGLRFNICGLESSYLFNDDVKDLHERMKKYISGHLHYACRYWSPHLVDASGCLSSCDWLSSMLWAFFRKNLLHWLEVMSVHGDTKVAQLMLDAILSLLHSIETELGMFAEDARKFIVHFDVPISDSVPHIYISALPLAPESSLVSKAYMPHFKRTLEFMGKDTNWSPLLHTLRGHSGGVYCVAFSPDGTKLASGDWVWDNTVRIWDAVTGQIKAGPFEGHSDYVNCVAFSPDGSKVASASRDNTIRIWDMSGQLEASLFEGYKGDVNSVAFSPDGSRLASANGNCAVRIWDINSGQLVQLGLTGNIEMHHSSSIAFSLDGSMVAFGSSLDGKTISIWDVASGQLVTTTSQLEGHNGLIQCGVFSPDGSKIASGSYDMTIRIWDTVSGQLVAGPFLGHSASVKCVAFSPDGSKVASGSLDLTIRIWDCASDQLTINLFKGHSSTILCIAFSPDGSRIASGFNDSFIRVWDVSSGEMVVGPFQGHTEAVKSVMFSSDGSRIVSGSHDKTVRIWDAVTGQPVAGPFTGHMEAVHSVAFLLDGSKVASYSEGAIIRVWNISGQLVAGPFQCHTPGSYITSVAFSPDGSKVVSGSFDQGATMWDIASAQVVGGPYHRADEISTVAFSADGCKLAVASATIHIWDIESCQVDGGLFQGHTKSITSVAFSPDGSKLVSGSEDQTVRIWDVLSGQVVAGPFYGHSAVVTIVAFSPDGLKVASYDGTVRIWDIAFDQLGHHDTTNLTTPPALSLTSDKVDMSALNMKAIYASSYSKDSGWIGYGDAPREKLLYWIPPAHRNRWCDFRTSRVIGVSELRVSYDDFMHGTDWTLCVTGTGNDG
ncbi:hypothetical protein SERLA73DRAFT_117440 [Serpula lacrymans var. lacrymans S7.3]|uniref:Uncharacterized protein n=1 Tax=Serpula lacrymans var. lacrymans (strain S7.3) TaxID=936435 RepID=F8QH46_SERL3|nr:hypothetical protein SERLA73DRAFT_117440 [Serpula lacrymans var. lacrymans S7.3]